MKLVNILFYTPSFQLCSCMHYFFNLIFHYINNYVYGSFSACSLCCCHMFRLVSFFTCATLNLLSMLLWLEFGIIQCIMPCSWWAGLCTRESLLSFSWKWKMTCYRFLLDFGISWMIVIVSSATTQGVR